LSERPGHRFELVQPESKSGAQHTSRIMLHISATLGLRR
jgi:hypothetical protein